MLTQNLQITDWEETAEAFKLKAKIGGEKSYPQKHPQRVGVKAATYHRMVIKRERDRVVLEFILDIRIALVS